MTAERCIRTHRKLWMKPTQTFNSISVRPGGLRFVTQNLSKPSKNTEWVKADPENRQLTWIFQGQKTIGCVRQYKDSEGHIVTTVEGFRPDRLIHKEVA